MGDDWRTLLTHLTRLLPRPLLLAWVFKDGTRFQMILPSEREFAARTFRSNLEFPYEFDQISEVRTVELKPDFFLSDDERKSIIDLVNSSPPFRTSMQDGKQIVIQHALL